MELSPRDMFVSHRCPSRIATIDVYILYRWDRRLQQRLWFNTNVLSIGSHFRPERTLWKFGFQVPWYRLVACGRSGWRYSMRNPKGVLEKTRHDTWQRLAIKSLMRSLVWDIAMTRSPAYVSGKRKPSVWLTLWVAAPHFRARFR